jgi:hypothetical protein
MRLADRVCARPGCGHNRRHVNYTIGGTPEVLQNGHQLDGCHVLTETPEGWMRCPCPSYRTLEQQGAWALLAAAIELTGRAQEPEKWVLLMDLNVVRGYGKRLLELYP